MAALGTILVVDDDPQIAEVISDILGDEGYTVRVVNDGEAGLAAIHADTPDLVLMDYRLPGMSGLAVVQAVREQGMDTLPIVLVTAEHPMRVREQIGSVDGYLFKPFDMQELIDCVARCLRGDWTSEELRRAAEELRAAAEEARQVHATVKADLARMREEFALEREIAEKLLEELRVAVADADDRAQRLAELLGACEPLQERQHGDA